MSSSLFRVLVARPYVSVLLLRRSFSVATAATKPTTESSPDALLATTTSSSSSTNDEPLLLFESLKGVIDKDTLSAIKHTHMSPVQARIFPLLPDLVLPYDPDAPQSTSKRKDLLVKAKTGTGKTMGFLIPAIEARIKAINSHIETTIDDNNNTALTITPQLKKRAIHRFCVERVGTLIVSPTRELATQIAVEAGNLTRHHVGFQIRVLLGGESKKRQVREWEGRKDIVVCTPGRILDLIDSVPKFSEPLKYTQMLILDEADTLLELGFKEDIEGIKAFLPPSPERQTLLFSATVSSAIRQVAISTMSSTYKVINCVPVEESPVHDHIPQYHTVVADPSQLFSYLLQLIIHDQLVTGGNSKIIIFFSTTKNVQLFASLLNQIADHVLPSGRKTKVYEMHAKRDMEARIRISKSFRNDTSGSSILFTTDVSARGVDYPGVSRVIQMGIPVTGDMYIHRVGRTGRGDNKTGRGDLVLCSWEMPFLKRQLSKVSLKPLIMSDLIQETKELAKAKDAESSSSDCSSRLKELEPRSRKILGCVGEEVGNEVFMAQMGFYFGRIQDMGLNRLETLEGLQMWTKTLFQLPAKPFLSSTMRERLGLIRRPVDPNLANNRKTAYRPRIKKPWGGPGKKSAFAPPSSLRPPWEGRGNQNQRSRSSPSRPWDGRENRPLSKHSDFGGGGGGGGSSERSGGFGFSSRDSPPRSSSSSSSSYSSRYGSRDFNNKRDEYTPRSSSSSPPRSSSSSSSFGSRDYGKPGNARYGSSRGSSPRDSKSSSSSSLRYGSRSSSSDNNSSERYDWQ